MRAAFGVSTGLLLTGSGAALVLAYALRFLAISAGRHRGGPREGQPATSTWRRAASARARWRVLGTIHLPLIAPAIAAAAMLVFVDCMKELPATLLLQPFNFTTLATALYGEAKRGTYEDGAIAALAIVIVGLLPVLILARLNGGVGRGLRGAAPASTVKAPGPPV